MAEALATHARLRSGPYAQLVGPFLCPVGRLSELDACIAGGSGRPESLGLIVYPGDEQALRSVAREGVVQVEGSFGAKLPNGAGHMRRYFELPPGGDVAGPIESIAAAGARVKVRCGGATPDMVPSAERLAKILHRCAILKVPLKATAGLHQPFRHMDETTGAMQHGFLNLLAATSAAVEGGSQGDLVDLLTVPEDEDEAVVLDRIDRKARELLSSIGTCSLDEPVEALRALGLVE
jgi:hypothetical protein